jgi:FAD/FMN-containing dehydrogenase
LRQFLLWPEAVGRYSTLAWSNGLVVSVRSGGHNVSGNAVSDGGLMIRTDASSRHFDLNGEARMAKHSQNSAIITSI